MSYTSGPFALHAQQVLLEDWASHPNNTRLSYNNRVKEFIQQNTLLNHLLKVQVL
jgi:hypothetical protein